MRFFRHNDDYISLPDQEALFSLPFALFGHIEKRSLTALGWRWRKRAVVLNPSGHLIIYKYFLEGIGAGKPFVGRIIHLDTAEQVQARMDNDVCHIKIYDRSRRRTELRIKGTKARLWAAKVFIRSTAMEIEWPIEKRPLKLLDSRISTSSIYDADVVTKGNYPIQVSKLNTASVSSESLPDYTASDSSYQNIQLAASQTVDVQRVTIPEMITARVPDSKPSSFENVSMHNATLICGKSTADKKTETNSLMRRSQSATEFSTIIEFSTAQEATRSLSLDQLDKVLASRRDRFRKHLQSMLESRLYESLTECSLKCSVTSIRQLRAQAGNLRMSQVYIPYNNTLFVKPEEVQQKQQLAQCSGPSAPLSTDINCKLSEEEDSKNQTDIVYRL